MIMPSIIMWGRQIIRLSVLKRAGFSLIRVAKNVVRLRFVLGQPVPFDPGRESGSPAPTGIRRL